MTTEAYTQAALALSKLDQRSLHHFQQLAVTGAVTYSHRCMDSWLKDPLHPKVKDKRQAAVEALKVLFPLPVYTIPK